MERLAYTETGDPEGPQVWIIHGIMGSSRNWGMMVKRLHKTYPHLRIISLDLRCHGESSDMSGPHSVTRCAEDLNQLTAVLGKPQCIIGHSFGGKVALCYASLFASGLEMVWTLDSPLDDEMLLGHREIAKMIDACQSMPTPLETRAGVIDYFTTRGFSLGVAQWMTTNLKRTSLGFEWRFNLEGIQDLIQDYWSIDGWALLEEIPRSTQLYLLRAERGLRWSDEAIQRIAAVAPHISTPILEDSGHWVHVDQLDALIDMLDILNDL